MPGTSQVIMAAGAVSRMDGDTFVSAHSRYMQGARLAGAGMPGSAAIAGGVLDLRAYRERINARRIDGALREASPTGRLDGFSASAGFHLARSLEFIHKEVLEEQYPVPNAMRLFPMGETVPVGAQTHTMRRVYTHGEARIYRGPGDHVPRVGVQQREESWPIRHIVSGYGWDIFEAAASKFANSGLLAQLARTSRDAILELANRIWWYGAAQHNLYGVLTYPWLPKVDMSQGFLRATVAAAPDTTLGALHDIVNFPHQNSKSVFYPTVLAMTNRVHDVLSSVRFAAGSDTTIMEHFLKNTQHIKRVEIAWELENAGGTGIDGMLAYRDDARGIQLTMPEGVTQLPVEVHGFQSDVNQYASIGGVVMPDVLNNVLALVNTTV